MEMSTFHQNSSIWPFFSACSGDLHFGMEHTCLFPCRYSFYLLCTAIPPPLPFFPLLTFLLVPFLLWQRWGWVCSAAFFSGLAMLGFSLIALFMSDSGQVHLAVFTLNCRHHVNSIGMFLKKYHPYLQMYGMFCFISWKLGYNGFRKHEKGKIC